MCDGQVGEESLSSLGWSPPGSEDEETDLRSYGSVLRYKCGLARRFLEAESDSLYEERNMTCHWNRTWSPQAGWSTLSAQRLQIRMLMSLCLCLYGIRAPIIDYFCALKPLIMP